MIEFTKGDLNKLVTAMAIFKRGKYDLEGEEILAAAQSFAWLSQLAEKIKTNLEAQPCTQNVEVKAEKKAKK